MANYTAEIEITGIEEMMAALVKKGVGIGRASGDALKAAAKPVAEDMKSMVHVSTENHKHIRDDIQISGVKSQGDIKYVTVGPTLETSWRAKFLEYGTSRQAAYPFVAPAAEKNRAVVTKTIAEVLGGAK
jgi:HK97 gp10 family phage protein